jgi:hypothetical protein
LSFFIIDILADFRRRTECSENLFFKDGNKNKGLHKRLLVIFNKKNEISIKSEDPAPNDVLVADLVLKVIVFLAKRGVVQQWRLADNLANANLIENDPRF